MQLTSDHRFTGPVELPRVIKIGADILSESLVMDPFDQLSKERPPFFNGKSLKRLHVFNDVFYESRTRKQRLQVIELIHAKLLWSAPTRGVPACVPRHAVPPHVCPGMRCHRMCAPAWCPRMCVPACGVDSVTARGVWLRSGTDIRSLEPADAFLRHVKYHHFHSREMDLDVLGTRFQAQMLVGRLVSYFFDCGTSVFDPFVFVYFLAFWCYR